jgi:hypothetical protein
MALDTLLVSLLRDPVDRGSLVYLANESILLNPRRKVVYDVRGAIPVLLPDECRAVDDAEVSRIVGDATAVTTGDPA